MSPTSGRWPVPASLMNSPILRDLGGCSSSASGRNASTFVVRMGSNDRSQMT